MGFEWQGITEKAAESLSIKNREETA